MTDPGDVPDHRETLAVALDALRDEVFRAIDDNAAAGFIGPARIYKIRDATRAVEQLGLISWERRS